MSSDLLESILEKQATLSINTCSTSTYQAAHNKTRLLGQGRKHLR